ncbi:MAG TPA: PQQ-binding-like beta-propeller repeat protein [Ktedonobacteraceae bacterium]
MLRRLLPLFFILAFILTACGGNPPSNAPVSHNQVIPPNLLQSSSSDVWPDFAFGPGHTSSITTQGSSSPIQGKLLWSKPLSPIFSSPVAGQHMLYIASTDGYLYALQQDTGSQVWRILLKDELTDATPALEGQVLFVAMRSANLEALNALTGHVYWTFPTGEKIQAPPLAIGGHVLVVTSTTLWALDDSTGRLLWKFHIGPAGWPSIGSPTVVGKTVYIGLGSSTKLWALDLASGHTLWSFDTKDRIMSAALAQANTIYIATWHGNIFALNSSTGQQSWRYVLNANQGQQPVEGVGGSMALANGSLFVGDYRGDLSCLDAVRGGLKWRFPTGAQILATPVISGNQAYIGSGDGKLYALNVQTGRPSWIYSTGEIRGSAALANGHLYVGSMGEKTGEIYAFV